MHDPDTAEKLRALARHPAAAPGLIVLVVLAVYANSLRGEFTFDDAFVLMRAPILRAGACTPRCWVPPDYFDASGEFSYRPAVTATYVLQAAAARALDGGAGPPAAPLPPWPFKAGNLLLHAGVALLVWRLGRLWLGPGAALFAALLFGVHPVTTEVVNAVGFREDLLAALFVAACFLAMFRWMRGGGAAWLAGGLLALEVGMLSKENAIVAPLLLAACVAATPGERRSPRAWSAAAAAAAVAATHFYLFGVLLRNSAQAPYAWLEGFTAPTWLLAGRLLAAHLRILLFPAPLIADRIFLAGEKGSVAALAALTAAMLVMVALAFVWAWRRDRAAFQALVWIFLPLAPYLGVARLMSPVADRFCYLSAIGLALLAARAGEWWRRAGDPEGLSVPRRRLTVGLAIALLAGCGLATARRNEVWWSNESLWVTTLRQEPRSAKANGNVGTLLAQRRGPAAAIPCFEQAARLDRYEARYGANLAFAYAPVGRFDEALAIVDDLLRRGYRAPDFLLNVARLHLHTPTPAPDRAAHFYQLALEAGAGRDGMIESALAAAGQRKSP